MSLRPPSFVSPTTAFTLRTSSLSCQESTSATTPSTAAPTPSVLVRTMGDSIVPSSWTWVAPASLPKALPTNTAPATLSRKTLPGCGTIAVTPVRMRSPSTRVRWPTRTPATSVMASRAPGGNTPGASPMSRDRGRASGPAAVITDNPDRAGMATAAVAARRPCLMRGEAYAGSRP